MIVFPCSKSRKALHSPLTQHDFVEACFLRTEVPVKSRRLSCDKTVFVRKKKTFRDFPAENKSVFVSAAISLPDKDRLRIPLFVEPHHKDIA